MLNLSMLLEDSARRYPDRDAVVHDTEHLTYADLNARANQVANLLTDHGITPGDKVALSLPNISWFPALYYGILKAGAVVVPLNILLKGREVAYHLADSHAKAYFCAEGTPELPIADFAHEGFAQTPGCEHLFVISADPDAPPAGVTTLPQALDGISTERQSAIRKATDTAVILYTSGTTGQPKGAELSHANMVLNAEVSNRLFDSHPRHQDTHLTALPLFHTFGQTVNMNGAFSVAATLILLPRFDAKTTLEIMDTHDVTVFAGVPTMYWGLLDALDDSSVDVTRIAANLRKAISGGASLPVEILRKFTERFGVQILEGYGLSETSPLAIFSDDEARSRPGSIGTAVWGVEVQLVDPQWQPVTEIGAVGEIAIRGHNVMTGYFNRPGATDEVMNDGWFRSGDLARRDEDDYYYIVDRAKDMIVRGGFNVYPREIEEVLITHDAVSLAAVVGIPHDSHGEEVKAFIILDKDTAITEIELIEWTKTQMAAYKYPRHIEFVDTLPMTATGKILKRSLA
ncbi:MAG: long-chain fatty acid--CoA ligase [Rhodococcus sp. (in: high G+C Gram-positive bacteria)]|uniref:long-chain-fatty-acid--CoA ligase n=1 Tax=Rhodococcus sp. TaxID=1831 RepID=UPI001225978A|nr:long-chain fatty acid--CoA ligase [Rhodococcus sp. (in: high G+C Gram-positive bacteria)]RZL23036.1 MAG: long-chain fatty acid--CoA ligase [Rhodococcus sp. (in: high G+C Gram-positive bacteria)]